jgi:hypothetical protein
VGGSDPFVGCSRLRLVPQGTVSIMSHSVAVGHVGVHGDGVKLIAET